VSLRRAKKWFETVMPIENRHAGLNLRRIEQLLMTGEKILAAKIWKNSQGNHRTIPMRLFWD